MENLKSFDKLLDRCARFDASKHDAVVESHQFYVNDLGDLVVPDVRRDFGYSLKIEDRALQQMASRFGPTFWGEGKRTIPLEMYRQMRDQFSKQFAGLTNDLLDQVDDKFLIRCFDNHARAFLSQHYVTLDNRDVLEMASEVLGGVDFEIIASGQYYARNDGVQRDEMAIRVVVKNVLPPDEPTGYGLGVLIRNGETGGSATEIRPLVMRTSCMNSLVFKRDEDGEKLGIHLTHRGVKTAKTMLLASAIAEALPMAEEGLERYLQTKTQQIDLSSVIANLGTEHGWSEEMRFKVATGSEGHESVYGLINGLTYAAHEMDVDTSTRLDMESLAATFAYRPKVVLAASEAD